MLVMKTLREEKLVRRLLPGAEIASWKTVMVQQPSTR